jgi:hypothetical protein
MKRRCVRTVAARARRPAWALLRDWRGETTAVAIARNFEHGVATWFDHARRRVRATC